MGSGEVAIVALSTMISLKVTFSDGLGGCKVTGVFQGAQYLKMGNLPPRARRGKWANTWLATFMSNEVTTQHP